MVLMDHADELKPHRWPHFDVTASPPRLALEEGEKTPLPSSSPGLGTATLTPCALGLDFDSPWVVVGHHARSCPNGSPKPHPLLTQEALYGEIIKNPGDPLSVETTWCCFALD